MSGNYFALLGDDGDDAPATPVVQEKETQQAKTSKPSQVQYRAKQNPKGKGQVEQSRNNNQGRNNQNKFRGNNSAHNDTHENGALINAKKSSTEERKKKGVAGSGRRFHGNSRGRTYDRSSHSTAKGMLPEKKRGAGKSNWGTQPDAEKAYEEEGAVKGEQPEHAEGNAVEEEEEKSVTLDEYTKDREVALLAKPQRKAGEGVDNSEWEKTGATQYKKEELVETNNKVQKKKKKQQKKDVIPLNDVLTVHTEPRGDKRNKKFGDRKKNEPRNNKRTAPTTLQVDDNAFPVLKSGSS